VPAIVIYANDVFCGYSSIAHWPAVTSHDVFTIAIGQA